MAKQYWLVKQEPEKYSWDDFVADGTTYWDGVRNYQARNNLRAMKLGDLVFFYRSVKDPAVIGECKVSKTAYPDPTAKEGDWSVVDLTAGKKLKKEVTLAEIKGKAELSDIALIKQSRLSVMPLTKAEYQTILTMSKE
ncbi:MAG: EVE domain-containing protein [Verrucomicrobiota bacterium]